MTVDELETIRQQFIRCWIIDPGMRNLDRMVVRVRVSLNPDRTVRSAVVTDYVDPQDPIYRSFAESAVRAVLNPRCSPVDLPPRKFHLMRTFTLRFSGNERG